MDRKQIFYILLLALLSVGCFVFYLWSNDQTNKIIESQQQEINQLNAAHMQKMKSNKDLISAVKAGDLTKIQELIKSGADVNAKDADGRPALMCDFGNIEIVNELIKDGVNVNATSPDKKTALIRASESGNIDILKALIAAGANVNAKDSYGKTALAYASQNKSTEIINILKTAGAN